MASPLAMEQFPDLLDSRFREIFDGSYGNIPDMIGKFYTKQTSSKDVERGSALTDGPGFDDFALNGQVLYAGPEQSYDWSSTYRHFCKGTQIEKDLLMFDQFDVIDGRWSWLAESAAYFQQQDAARIFNYAFQNDTHFYNHTEGVALCSNSHTTVVSGVSTATGFDNLTTSALSPTALKSALTQALKFKTPQGKFMPGLNFDTLVVPIDLQWTAQEIVGTALGFEPEVFGDKTKNVLQGKFDIIPWILISDTNDWFLVDSSRMKKNLIWFEHQALKSDRDKDLDTFVAKYVADMYYSVGLKDWRWILGSQVS